jgi:hypothetical protein
MADDGLAASGRPWRASARAALAVLAVVALPGPAAAAGDALAGSWRGPASTGEVRVEVRPETRGALSVRWTTLGGAEASVRLEPTARPGVLAAAAEASGGLRGMLGGGGDAEGADPLAGRPLVWARRDARGLYLYRLEVAGDGRPALDHYDLEPDAAGLSFTASRIGPGGEAQGGLRAALAREGAAP